MNERLMEIVQKNQQLRKFQKYNGDAFDAAAYNRIVKSIPDEIDFLLSEITRLCSSLEAVTSLPEKEKTLELLDFFNQVVNSDLDPNEQVNLYKKLSWIQSETKRFLHEMK